MYGDKQKQQTEDRPKKVTYISYLLNHHNAETKKYRKCRKGIKEIDRFH